MASSQVQLLRLLMLLDVVACPCESSGEAISHQFAVTVVDEVEKRTGLLRKIGATAMMHLHDDPRGLVSQSLVADLP